MNAASATGSSAKGNIANSVLADIQKRLQEQTAAAPVGQPSDDQVARATTGEGAVAARNQNQRRRAGEMKEDQRFLMPSLEACRAALERVAGFSKQSISLEMGICMAVYVASNGATLPAKQEMRIIYQGAGYNCATHTDPDYKTVMRRLNAAAALFDKIGIDEMRNVVEGKADADMIQAVAEYLEKEYDLTSLNAVWAAADRPVVAKHDFDYDEGETAPRTGRGARSTGRTPGQPGTGGTDEQGRPLTAAGTVDQRIKPSDEQPSLATQVARGEISKEDADKQAGKQPEEGKAPQGQAPTGADARLAETVGQAVERKQGEAPQQNYGRRRTDSPNATVIEVGVLHLAIPHDAPYDDIIGMITELMVLAQSMEEAGLANKDAKTSAKTANKTPATQH
jgi:hypothetical protein